MNNSNSMGNNQIKKRAAEEHNKKRREAHVERVRIEQDKIDNPEKYKRKPRQSRKAQAFITTALALDSSGFDARHTKPRKYSKSPTFAMPYGKPPKPILEVGGKYNFKNQPERLMYIGKNWSGNGYWHQFEKVDEPGVVWSEMQDSDLLNLECTVEEPTLIKNWLELEVVEGSRSFTLDITPEDGSGWIRNAEGNFIEYLSTHTFYGSSYEYSTELLQKYGFNVIIDNWDKVNEKEEKHVLTDAGEES